MMSNQSETEMPLSETASLENVRQFLLADLNATRQAISELSEEELEAISGGGCLTCNNIAPEEGQPVHIGNPGDPRINGIKASYLAMRDVGKNPIKSMYLALRYGPRTGTRLAAMDVHYTSAMRALIRDRKQN